MIKYYMVDTVSTFHNTYLVAMEESDDPTWAHEVVMEGDGLEIAQRHLGDSIILSKEANDKNIKEAVAGNYNQGWSVEEFKAQALEILK